MGVVKRLTDCVVLRQSRLVTWQVGSSSSSNIDRRSGVSCCCWKRGIKEVAHSPRRLGHLRGHDATFRMLISLSTPTFDLSFQFASLSLTATGTITYSFFRRSIAYYFAGASPGTCALSASLLTFIRRAVTARLGGGSLCSI